ncbi:MAG: Stage IV sporulation protein FB [Firmicutes bacterium ADurb.Bin193]|nr:MAG: Stage IV sporulation protein FB [Firmicutes bacterium ADurb.Bin193]
MLKPIRLKKVEIHPSFLLLLFFAIVFDFIYYLSVAYIMVIIHELAHAAAALSLGVKLDTVEILPFGVAIKISGSYIKNPVHEIIISAAGPLCSAGMAFLCHRLMTDSFFVMVNLSIALINIIPALPLDGGRILKAFLTERWGYVKAFNFTVKITRVCAVVVSLAGAAFLFYTRFNFSLILIGAFLVVNTVAEQRSSAHIMMNEIIKSREKLSRGCAERAGVIAISADEPAGKALKLLSYNRYYLINVINSDMDIIGTLTETRLIELLVEMGIRTKAAKMVDLDNR